MQTPTDLQSSGTTRFDLTAVFEELEREEAYWSSRRAAASLVKEDELTVVITTVQKGETIRAHAVPSPAFVTVLEGALVVRFEDHDERLEKGQGVAFAGGVRHSVEAPEDARFLVVLGGNPQLAHLES